MSLPASRFADLCVCGLDMASGTIVGPCAPNVFIDGLPAARVGDVCVCMNAHVSQVAEGAAMVRINGMPAARMGVKVTGGGFVTMGSPSVLIGDG